MSINQVQTSVAANAVIGLPGDVYDSEPHSIVTKRCTEATPFGVWVAFTTEEEAELPDAAGEVTGIHGGGIALRDPNKPSGVGYEVGDVMRVLVHGRAFVLAEEAVAITDTPFARYGSGAGGTQKGAFRNDGDTSTAATPPNTRFFKGGSATQPPVLELL